MTTTLYLKKFGDILVSRPAGREAWLAAQAYSLPKGTQSIVVNFESVRVLAPSWADEFLTPLREKYGAANVQLLHANIPSVIATLQTLEIPV